MSNVLNEFQQAVGSGNNKLVIGGALDFLDGNAVTIVNSAPSIDVNTEVLVLVGGELVKTTAGDIVALVSVGDVVRQDMSVTGDVNVGTTKLVVTIDTTDIIATLPAMSVATETNFEIIRKNVNGAASTGALTVQANGGDDIMFPTGIPATSFTLSIDGESNALTKRSSTRSNIIW